MKRIAIMTGGGDCPGLNAAIRAATLVAINYHGLEVIGIRNGFEGMITNDTVPLGTRDVRGVLRVGGTMLGSSNRTNPFRYTGTHDDAPEEDASGQAYDNLRQLDVEALVVLGGDGTLLLSGLFSDMYDVPVVGIPKTIDNDVRGSDYAIGFDSAVHTVTDAVDKLHTTAESHHRVILIEAMGRTAGWIALYSGVAGGADIVLIPERAYSIDGIVAKIERRASAGRHFTIAVVAEGSAAPGGGMVYRSQTGAEYSWRLGGICENLCEILDNTIQQDVRSLVLGHLQRGGSPSPFDRALATQFGARAVEAVVDGEHNVVVGVRGTELTTSPLQEVSEGPRLVPADHPLVKSAMQMGMYVGE